MEIRKPKQKFGEILVEMGAITVAQLKQALDIQRQTKKRTGEILLELGIITEEVLIAALGKQLGTPYIDISLYHINMEALPLLTKAEAESQNTVIFDTDEDALYVAASDPLNYDFLSGLEKKHQKKIHLFLTRPTEIQKVTAKFYGD